MLKALRLGASKRVLGLSGVLVEDSWKGLVI